MELRQKKIVINGNSIEEKKRICNFNFRKRIRESFVLEMAK